MEEIIVVFGTEDFGPLGNIWRITAKKTDFYLDPISKDEAFHLSVHGPNDRYSDGHRFHVKVDRKAVANVAAQGGFILHSIPHKGHAFDGQELATDVFRVARIRWLWDLQRPRFQPAAAFTGTVPDISGNRSGAKLFGELEPNEAADIDLFVSYKEPYWPNSQGSLRNNARLGPLYNYAGMCLTATSFRRSQVAYPAPDGLVPRLPKPNEEPNRILGGAPGQDSKGDMYWFVEAITSRDLIKNSMQNSGN